MPKLPLLFLFLIGFLAIGVASKVGLLRLPMVVRVQAIECKTQYGPCTLDEERSLGEFLDQDFLLLDTTLIQKRVLERDFKNKRILVEKVFPNKLVVVLEKRKPIVVLDTPQAQGVFFVDKEGMVIGSAESSTLPLLLVDTGKNFVVGEPVLEEVINASKILYLVYTSQGTKQGVLANQVLAVTLSGGTLVSFLAEAEPEAKVGALQLITSRSRMDGKLPKTIDLRYSKPVLTY